jgi:hypothetical protein
VLLVSRFFFVVVFFSGTGFCHISCFFNMLARKVRRQNTPFAEQKYQTFRPKLQFMPAIDNHTILWLRNWLGVS